MTMLKQCRPWNLSRSLIPVVNEEKDGSGDISFSSQSYPAGGICVERGRGKVSRGSMVTNVAEQRDVRF